MDKPYSYDKKSGIYCIVINNEIYCTYPNLMYKRVVDTMFFKSVEKLKAWRNGAACDINDFICITIKRFDDGLICYNTFQTLLSYYHGCKEYDKAGLLLYQLLHSYFKREDERYTFQVSQGH